MKAASTVDPRNPFPGLRPFREEEADRFFGQEDRIEDLVYRLSRQRFVALLGLSGSGKSSLVNAGLLAQLRQSQLPDGRARWRICRMNPGQEPLTHLAAALEPRMEAQAEVREELDRDTRGMARWAERAGLDPRQKILLVIDQFEELFRYQEGGGPERKHSAAHFVQLFLEAVNDESCPIHVLLVMRSEFLGDCATFYDLAEQVNASTYLIPKMDRESAAEVITQPVELRGAMIEPPLVQHLLNESEVLEDGLPLLQHALRRLWDRWARRGEPASPIGWADLAELSLEADLDRDLNEIYTRLTPRQQQTAERLFRELADRDAKGRVTRRTVDASSLDLPELPAVVEAFQDEKSGRMFLVRSGATLDISHECLLRRWDRVREWLKAEDRDVEQSRMLAAAANDAGWPQPIAALEGFTLETLGKWRAASSADPQWARRYEIDFAAADAYLKWSIEQAEAKADQEKTKAARIRELEVAEVGRLRRERRLLLFLVVGALVAAVGMFWLWRQAHDASSQARASEKQAEQSKKDAEANAARADRERDGALEAKTREEKAKQEAQDNLSKAEQAGEQAAVSAREADLQLALNHWQNSRLARDKGEDVVALHLAAEAIRRDKSLLQPILLDIRGLEPTPVIEKFLTHAAPVLGAQFNRDESRILTRSSDNTARVWDARTGQAVGPPLQHQGSVNGARFNRDESRILTWSYDNTARVWDARTGQAVGPRLQHQGRVYGAQFNRDESRILTWSGDKTARVWDARTGQAVGPPLQHQASVIGAQFNRDESRILTWSDDNTARVWDARTGQAVGPALQHQGAVYGAQFNRDESRILTWSFDNTARVWFLEADLDFPAEYVPLRVQALTATEYDFVTRQLKMIEPTRWRQIKERYEKIAAEHARVCQYPDANDWLRRRK